MAQLGYLKQSEAITLKLKFDKILIGLKNSTDRQELCGYADEYKIYLDSLLDPIIERKKNQKLKDYLWQVQN